MRFEMPQTEWASLLNRAGAERRLGEAMRALRTDQEALRVAQEHNNRVWEAGALYGIGEDLDALEDREQAHIYLCRALALYRQNGEVGRAERLIEFMREKEYVIPDDDEE